MKRGVFIAAILAAVFGALGSLRAQETKTEKREPPFELSGLLREEAYYIFAGQEAQPPLGEDRYMNILETRLILEARRQDWRYYGDARHYLYHGLAAGIYGPEQTRVVRSMVRYTAGAAQVSFGKTYVNFGNPGIFNPFEIDKSVNLADINYTREGIVAGEFVYYWQALGSLKLYAGGNDPQAQTPMAGFSPLFHLGSFNAGAVVNRSGFDRNIAGAFFKGDLLLGWQGSWAAWYDDRGDFLHYEGAFGADYSIFQRLTFALQLYYNGAGASDPSEYTPSTDAFLQAAWYGYGTLYWLIDEFHSVGVTGFYNAIDQSYVIMPTAQTYLTSGFSLSVIAIVLGGSGNDEFSRETSGAMTTMVRLEAKF